MNQDMQTLLRISRKHVSLAKKSKSQLKIDNSIVSIVFSAMSVESAINVAICLPVLRVKSRKQRIFFGTLLTKYFSASIPKKLSFLLQVYPELRKEKDLCKTIRNLFKFRNEVVHSTPRYSEAKDSTEVFEYMEEEKLSSYEVNESFLPTTPVLHLTNFPSVDIPVLAEEYYNAASSFVQLTNPLSLDQTEDAYLENMI